MKVQTLVQASALAWVMLCSGTAFAAHATDTAAPANTATQTSTDPVSFIKETTEQMIAELNAQHTQISKNPALILAIVKRLVMPRIARKTIARRVMGRIWRNTDKTKRARFVKEFSIYLNRYYSKVFLAYNHQTIVYKPKAQMLGTKYAVVTTRLLRPGKATVTIQYKLKSGKKGWKVVDIVIEGISLVINNQRQYAGQIAREGLDAVIAKLSYNNQRKFE